MESEIELDPNKADYSTFGEGTHRETPAYDHKAMTILSIIQTIVLFLNLACLIFLAFMSWKAYDYISNFRIDLSDDRLFCFIIKIFGHTCGLTTLQIKN